MNANPSTANARDNLWWLAAGPAAWFTHFLLCYITAAVACAKAGAQALPAVRTAVAFYTLVALLVIIAVGWRGYCQQRHHLQATLHDDSAAGRRRFLGATTFLLCGLSVVATVYVALVVAFIGSCR